MIPAVAIGTIQVETSIAAPSDDVKLASVEFPTFDNWGFDGGSINVSGFDIPRHFNGISHFISLVRSVIGGLSLVVGIVSK